MTTKLERTKFVKLITDWLATNGAIKRLPDYDGCTAMDFVLNTESGLLAISIPSVANQGMFHVFCQFRAEVNDKAIALGAHPRNGKMNYHFSSKYKINPKDAADYFINDMDSLLVECKS
jgi:hypothetical protein